MRLERRTLLYSSLLIVMALILSAGLLQLTQTTAKSAPLHNDLPEFNNTLTITKTVLGAAPTTDWEFTIVGNGIFSTVTVAKEGGSVDVVLPAQPYTVTETMKEGYGIADSYCESEQFQLFSASVYVRSTVNADLTELDDACEFVNSEFSQLTVVKDATPEGPQEFDFVYDVFDMKEPIDIIRQVNASFVEPNFTLVDDGTGISDTYVITGLVANSAVELAEYVPEGWVLDNVQCEDENGPLSGWIDDRYVVGAKELIKVNPIYPTGFEVQAGMNYTCTFTNLGAALAVTKTVGTDPNTCAGTSQIDVFTGTEVHYCYEATNTGGLTLTKHTLDDSVLSNLFTDLPYELSPGETINTIDEGVPAPYTATVDTTNVATWTAVYTYSPFIFDILIKEVDVQASQEFDLVQPIVVTIPVTATTDALVNVFEPSTIVVDKVTLPEGSEQVFDFALADISEEGPPAVPFTATDQIDYVSPNLLPGTYAVTEQALPDGWGSSGPPTCSDDTGASYDASAIQLTEGITVTCVFTNERLGRIVVDKETNPTSYEGLFDFTISGGEWSDTFSLANDTEPYVSEWLFADSYTVVETPKDDWTLTSTTCDDGSPVDDIDLDYGETVTCTFVNEADDPTALDDTDFPNLNEKLYLPLLDVDG